MNNGISDQYIYAACKFHTDEGVPFKNLLLSFKQWLTYVEQRHAIDINQLDYGTFTKTLEKCKQETLSVGEIYNDGTVSIRRITDFEQMKKLPFANIWCIRKAHWWKDYKKKEPPAEFLLITNKNYTEDSNCMYVMVEMYSNGEIGYWSTDNELIDETNSSGRLPTLKAYQSTLGAGLSVIEQERKRINNQQNINCNKNMNKNRIRLTESQLHRVIKESVKRALNEENGFSYLGHMRDAIEDAIYSTINDLAAKKAIEEGQLNMMKQSLSRFVCGTFEGACRQILQRPDSSFYNSLHDGEFLPPSAY